MMAMLSSWLHRIAADCTLLFPSRAVLLQRVPNLCVMGGDAHAIVRSHLRPCSVSHVFINFPEPPSGYQVIALQLPWNRPATSLHPEPPSSYQLPWNRPATALQLPCNCPRAIRLNFVRLPRISRLSHCRLRVIARGLCAPERLGHC